MFAGAYWSKRAETREEAALRLVVLLRALAESSADFSRWYSKGRSKAAALRNELSIDVLSIAHRLSENRTDVGNNVIVELGFSVGVWNGDRASLSATIGCYAERVGNAVVLRSETTNIDEWRKVLRHLVDAFEPDDALVACTERVASSGAEPADVAWLTYTRAAGVEEHPERR